MMPWDAKKEDQLGRFLKEHNPSAPPRPKDELARLRERLQEPAGRRHAWRFWMPTVGAMAGALLIWMVTQKPAVRAIDEEAALDSVETAHLIDEEPGNEWSLLIGSID